MDGTQTFSVDGPYIAKMKDERRILTDKPREIMMPVLPPVYLLASASPAKLAPLLVKAPVPGGSCRVEGATFFPAPVGSVGSK